jgi:hypothetical protein
MYLALFAGFSAGIAVCLGFIVYLNLTNLAKSDAERKRWVNKALIRDGQAKIFPDASIEPAFEMESSEKTAPMIMRSPLAAGKVALREQVETNRQKTNGNYLPDDVKEKIKAAAESIK